MNQMPSGRPTILDGGMSRELIRLGAPLRQPEWSALALIETPDLVRQVHHEFIEAGADVVTTNSYALVPFHIGEDRFRTEGLDLAALAGRLAREAADASGRPITVAGSLPPVFGSYEPQLFNADKAGDYLAVLVRGLTPFVDVWLGETLSLIAEGEAVRQATAHTGKPFWISFTLDDTGSTQAARLRSGEPVADAAAWALQAGAEALLFNCSRPEHMEAALREAGRVLVEARRNLPLGVYANAFEPGSNEGSANEGLSATRADLTAEPYTAFACDWVANGASMVGGCCGIGATHIHALAQALGRH